MPVYSATKLVASYCSIADGELSTNQLGLSITEYLFKVLIQF